MTTKKSATGKSPLRKTITSKIIGLGEILWDLLPTGAQLGGAPGNFAYHARALGAEAGIVTRVGDDALGRDILARLAAMQLPLDLVQIDAPAPTGTVTVKLNAAGVPDFTIHEGVAWDRLELTAAARRAVQAADAVCFGSLAQRAEPSRSTILDLVRQAPAKALRIFDVNLRQHYFSREVIERSLQLANVAKLNDTELPVLAEMFGLPGDTRAQIAALAARFDLRVVALTLGARGSLLYRGGQWSECHPRPVTIVDTVGAGDAFTAAMAHGFLRGMELDEVNCAAGEVARHVCACAGATPSLPEALARLFSSR